jgi:hypothetical protein
LKIEFFDYYLSKEDRSSLPVIALSVRLLIPNLRYFVEDMSKDAISQPLKSFLRVLWCSEHSMRKAAFQAAIGIRGKPNIVPLSHVESHDRLNARAPMDCFERSSWCRSQASQVCMLYEYPIANYFACIRRSHPSDIIHGSCEPRSKCKPHNVKINSSYETIHAGGCAMHCGKIISVDTC